MRDAEESIVDVIISTDGSWKAVSDNKDSSSQKQNSFWYDTKRSSAAEKLVLPEVNWHQSAASALSGLAANCTSLSAHGNNVSVAPPLTSMQSPVLPDTVSLACQKGHMDDHRRAQATPSMQNHLLRRNYLNTQQSSYGSSRNKFERFTSINRQADRSPRQPWLYQNAFHPIGASAATSQITHSMAANIGGHDSFQKGTERMNQASWSNINASISTTISSSSMQNHSVRQVYLIFIFKYFLLPFEKQRFNGTYGINIIKDHDQNLFYRIRK